MKILQANEPISIKAPIVATIGMFDGVHLGHRKLLNFVETKAQEVGGSSLLISFKQHPRMVLYNDQNLQQLNTFNEKVELLKSTGIQYFLPLDFTEELSNLTAFEFVRDHLVNTYNIQHLIVGHDHHFGRNREGNFAQLQEFASMFDFSVEQFSAIEYDGKSISSTKIRTSLLEGEPHKANSMLGYAYFMKAQVIKGKGLGKKLGFPTSNLDIPTHKLVPKQGVYIAQAEYKGNQYKAMVNIGNQPTIDDDTLRIEAHLLDFSEDIYEEELRVNFLEYLREEKKFDSLEALQQQLANDKLAVLSYFND